MLSSLSISTAQTDRRRGPARPGQTKPSISSLSISVSPRISPDSPRKKSTTLAWFERKSSSYLPEHQASLQISPLSHSRSPLYISFNFTP